MIQYDQSTCSLDSVINTIGASLGDLQHHWGVPKIPLKNDSTCYQIGIIPRLLAGCLPRVSWPIGSNHLQIHPRKVTWNLRIPSWRRTTFTNHPFLDSMLVFEGVVSRSSKLLSLFGETPRSIHKNPYLKEAGE